MMNKSVFTIAIVAVLCFASAQAYSHSFGQRYAYYSAAAYCSSSAISNWNCRACRSISGFSRVSVVSHSTRKLQGFVGYSSSGEIVVSFRGTISTSITNWLTNLSFGKKSFPSACQGCQTHGGFLDSYLALQGQVLNAVRGLRRTFPNARIIVTGHSLGGAIATIAAADLRINQGLPVSALVTFGSPRVGNDMFALTIRNAIGTVASNRITHNKDLVVRVPPMNFGFLHVAREYWYRSASSYASCSTTGEDRSCALSIAIATSVSDHLNYLGLPISSLC